MKNILPYAAIAFILLITTFGWWYEVRSFASSPEIVPAVSGSLAGVNGKILRDANDTVTEYLSELKTFGEVPLSATNLPKDPDPLFDASE